MKDRVPTYPGRVILTPVAGQENTYDLTRADAPAAGYEGTPLNKEHLLTDATAAALGLDPADDPSPNNAFARIADGVEKIGDIKQTVRMDLGSKWLLCNGAKLDWTSYPDLNLVIPLFTKGTFANYTTVGAQLIESGNVQKIKHVNDRWFGLGDTGYYGYSTGSITRPTPAVGAFFTDVTYGLAADATNYYVIADPTNARLYSKAASGVNSASGWYGGGGALGYGPFNVVYGNGYFASLCLSGGFYTSQQPTTTWTRNTGISVSIATSTSDSKILRDYLIFDGTNFVLYDQPNKKLYYTTNPTQALTSWTCADLSSLVGSYVCNAGIYFDGSKYYIPGYYGGATRVFYADTLDGTWTYKEISGISATHFASEGNGIMVGTGAVVKHASSITADTWYTITISSGSYPRLANYASYDGTFAVSGSSSYGPSTWNTDTKVLPSISPTGAYAYIKALE